MDGECEECRKQGMTLQRSPVGRGSTPAAPPIVHEVLRSPGQPLDSQTRAFFEPRFGHDFSKVRVHTDAPAGESAAAVNALAYTVGSDVVFGHQQYAPRTAEGMKLIAHELAHTVQQKSSSSGFLEISEPGDPAENQAEAFAAAALSSDVSQSALTPGSQTLTVARDIASPQPNPQPVEQAPAPPQQQSGGEAASPACTPAPGYPPAGHCSAYLANAWWLPLAYVNNATCACTATPNVPTANCVRKFLQDRLAATPGWLMALAASQKVNELNPVTYPAYQAFVQAVLTPRIYQDHVDAYRSCCCPSGPAPYIDWVGVTTIPFQPCSLVGWFIDHFGSCTGTPGAW
jgi:hypothetical protein